MSRRTVFTLIFLAFLFAGTAEGAPSISGAEVWNDRGVERYRAGDFSGAVTCFETAHRLMPEDRTVRFNLASAHARVAVEIARGSMSAADYARACSEAEEAITLESDHAYFFSVLGFVHQQKNEHEAAYAAFARAAELDPKDEGARVLMGNAAYELDDLGGAMEHWSEALDIDPDLVHVSERLSKADRENRIEERFQTVENERFRVRYDPEEPDAERVAHHVLDLLDEARRRVHATLLARTAPKTSVVLYRPEDFRRFMDGREWTGGLYDGKIRVPFPGDAATDEDFLTLATHEYVHAVIYEWTADRCPAWLNEGFAQVLAGEWGARREEEARRLAIAGRLLPFTALEGSFLELPEESVDAAYLEAYVVVDHLLEVYTARHAERLLDRIAEGAGAEEALREVLHTSGAELLGDAFAPYGGKIAAR